MRLVVKAKTLPIGSVRTHGGVKKRKTAKGWVPVKKGAKPGKWKDWSETKKLKQAAQGFAKD